MFVIFPPFNGKKKTNRRRDRHCIDSNQVLFHTNLKNKHDFSVPVNDILGIIFNFQYNFAQPRKVPGINFNEGVNFTTKRFINLSVWKSPQALKFRKSNQGGKRIKSYDKDETPTKMDRSGE